MASVKTQLEDVLKANGEEHLYVKIMALLAVDDMEDAPPMIFGWQNVEGFLHAIEAAEAQAASAEAEPLAPSPLMLPPDVTVEAFKQAVLEHVRDDEAPARLGTSCLPCSIAQFYHVACKLFEFRSHPWTQRIIADGAPLPLAHIYVPCEFSTPGTLNKTISQSPNTLWG